MGVRSFHVAHGWKVGGVRVCVCVRAINQTHRLASKKRAPWRREGKEMLRNNVASSNPLKASGVSAPDSEESNLMILECQEVRSGWSCSARWQREHADELDS